MYYAIGSMLGYFQRAPQSGFLVAAILASGVFTAAGISAVLFLTVSRRPEIEPQPREIR
jgi:hypothetical protein